MAWLWKHCLDAEHCDPREGFGRVETSEKEQRKLKEPIDLFLARYVHIAKGDLVCDLKKEADSDTITLVEFKNSTANVRYKVPAPTKAEPDRDKLAPVHQAWLVHPSWKSVHTAEYRPDIEQRMYFDDGGVSRLNAFRLPRHGAKDPTISFSVFLTHMEYLLPNDAERKWFIDWLAFITQRLQQRCKVTPLHVSSLHGTGRGWVVELIEASWGMEL